MGAMATETTPVGDTALHATGLQRRRVIKASSAGT
ncbi:MAG: hypothetical protein V7643_2484, partial [Mycobacterium sp.]